MQTDTLDNTADLVRYGLMDADALEPAIAVEASTDLDVRESYESYKSTPRVNNEPPKPASRVLKSSRTKVG